MRIFYQGCEQTVRKHWSLIIVLMNKKKEIEKEDVIDLSLELEEHEEDLSWMIEDTVTVKKNKNGKEI